MPVKVETTHIILPRELIVYLRSDSDVWQCRLKVDNKWMARTTKERDVNKAIERAKRLLFEAQLRKEANIPVVTRKFRDIAKLAYQQMEDEETNANGTADEIRFTSTTASTLTLSSNVINVEKITVGTGTAASAVTTGTTALNINAANLTYGVNITGNAANNK